MTIRPALLFLLALPLLAHIGSPDVFYEGEAGPYRLLVTIRPPQVIPGVAEIEIRSGAPGVRSIRIVPLRLTASQQFAPVPDLARPSAEDPQFFTGSLWLMTTGSWQVRITVDGDKGRGTVSVPVPALANRTLGMQKPLGILLAFLGVLLCGGLVSIAGASVRDAPLETGSVPDSSRRRRAGAAMAVTACLLAAILYLGNQWWSSEQGVYRQLVFKPLQLNPQVQGNRLTLTLLDPGWLNRRTDDLLPDHNHLMHLYVIRLPEMDRVMHLHPERAGEDFVQQLPDLPAGRYALYGDIVHADGIPETAMGEIGLPAIHGVPLAGDDAFAEAPALSKADYNRSVAALSGGGRMIWERGSAPLKARQAYLFRFRVEDAAGQPARDMQLYMGMLGHAAFVSHDRTVFAHVHPSGSVPMPALQLTEAGDPHAGHGMTMMNMEPAVLPAEVSFPYGFPKSGAYRIFVQIKRGGRIETGVFDTRVEN